MNTENTQTIKKKATMYFAYNGSQRPEIKARTTFEAIINGERKSTTRYPEDFGYQEWNQLKKGDLVQFFEDKDMAGRSIIVKLTKDPNPINFKEMTDKEHETWSKKEGWGIKYAKDKLKENKRTAGLQIEYEPLELLQNKNNVIKTWKYEKQITTQNISTTTSTIWTKETKEAIMKRLQGACNVTEFNLTRPYMVQGLGILNQKGGKEATEQGLFNILNLHQEIKNKVYPIEQISNPNTNPFLKTKIREANLLLTPETQNTIKKQQSKNPLNEQEKQLSNSLFTSSGTLKQAVKEAAQTLNLTEIINKDNHFFQFEPATKKAEHIKHLHI